MTMMKQYFPKSEKYFHLHSDVASVSDVGRNKKRYKWNIPLTKINDAEISVHSLMDSTITPDNTVKDAYEPVYTMRMNLPIENVFDTHYQDPILFQAISLNWQNVVNSPKLRLKNNVLNDISIDFTATERQSSDVSNDFLLNGVEFTICIKICDYEPEMLEEMFKNDANQRFARDLANLNL